MPGRWSRRNRPPGPPSFLVCCYQGQRTRSTRRATHAVTALPIARASSLVWRPLRHTSIPVTARATRCARLNVARRCAGEVRSEERMRGLLLWCVRNRVHLVVDEVFALSVFPSSEPFRSIMAVAAEVAASLPHAQAERLWEHVHVIYGLSKDFCMSGACCVLCADLDNCGLKRHPYDGSHWLEFV